MGERAMSDSYGRMERLGQMCPDIRLSAALGLAPVVEPAAARQAVGHPEGLDCGRMGEGAAGAACPV
jgi:hypothetical protein